MSKDILTRRIAVAAGRELADSVIKNGKIIDVFNGELIEGDIAIVDGYFAGIGTFEGKIEIDAKGSFISPALIDAHVHIESSMITPSEFANVVLMHGVTTVITDPHEIANVSGAAGIQYMLDSSDHLSVDVMVMLPSSVPAADFEYSGAVLNMEELSPFLGHPRVLGLAEVMNFPAVKNSDVSMLDKISETLKVGKRIDGHAAGLSDNDLNIYMAAGIRSDHEGTTAEEAKDRIRKGMYLMIREGTVAKDLKNIISAVTDRNSRRCLFVTDDKHLDDLIEEGSVDHNIRLAILEGLDPITAIQMATINPAEYYGLHDKGAIAPGYQADFLFIDNIEEVTIREVYKNGKAVVSRGKLITPEDHPVTKRAGVINTVHFRDLCKTDLQIVTPTPLANIIKINPNSLVTKHIVDKIDLDDEGRFQPSNITDYIKLALIERHKGTGLIGLGIVHGLGLKDGAIASTVAHDSHNLIIAGVNDQDILLAANELKRMQGGLVAVKNGEVLAALELPVAGLISTLPFKEVYNQLKQLNLALKELGASESFNPFLTLSFLALPVIPELKLTVQGLFDVKSYRHIEVGIPVVHSKNI